MELDRPTLLPQTRGEPYDYAARKPSIASVLCTHNVGEGMSLIFTLVKGMFTIIKKGTKDWVE